MCSSLAHQVHPTARDGQDWTKGRRKTNTTASMRDSFSVQCQALPGACRELRAGLVTNRPFTTEYRVHMSKMAFQPRRPALRLWRTSNKWGTRMPRSGIGPTSDSRKDLRMTTVWACSRYHPRAPDWEGVYRVVTKSQKPSRLTPLSASSSLTELCFLQPPPS
jgi:hypothetical protein